MRPAPRRERAGFTVRARAFMRAAGAIGTPALLLRSKLPDPHGVVGKRTFLHPVVVSAARCRPHRRSRRGPANVYSDHYLDTLPFDGPIGFKLEAPPIHPVLAAITLPSHGRAMPNSCALPNLHVQLALCATASIPRAPGAPCGCATTARPCSTTRSRRYLWEGVRRAMHVMADLQFAAGATQVMPIQATAPFGNARRRRRASTASPSRH